MVDTLDSIISDVQNFIVAPIEAFGLAGFVFDAEGESIANLSADITDHYTEDNRALQDHIAIRPKRITLKGYVGELVYNAPGASPSPLQKLGQKLVTIGSYLPALSSAATQLTESIQAPSASSLTLSSAANIFGLVQNVLGASGLEERQQNAYTYFKALMSQAVLMGVQTPWEFMSNMAIETITAIQPEPSRFITDFSITLKEIRIAQTLTTAFSPAQKLDGAAAVQAANPVQIGSVPGVGLPTNTLPGAQALITGATTFFKSGPIANIFGVH